METVPHYTQANLPGMDPPVFEQLSESVAACLAEAVIDREQGIVRNVALLGPQSKNGYRYTLEAMQQAVPLYDQRPVFVDHPETALEREGVEASERAPSRSNAPTIKRSVRDYAGRVVEPRFDGGRIRGDLHLAGPNAEWLLSLIESAPREIGMSHVVLARWNGAGTEVEHIEKVVSVDIVAFPATTRSFQESSPLAPRADSTRGASRPPSVTELVESSRIPPAARTEDLHRLLEKCPDPGELLALLESYWQSALSERSEPARSVEKAATATHERPLTDELRKRLVAAIRGR